MGLQKGLCNVTLTYGASTEGCRKRHALAYRAFSSDYAGPSLGLGPGSVRAGGGGAKVFFFSFGCM